MDAIVGYHLNPLRCGVARFNVNLAHQVDLPVLWLFDPEVLRTGEPLLSLKLEEFTPEDVVRLAALLPALEAQTRFQLFLHTFGETPVELRLVAAAQQVYCGNTQLAAAVRPYRPDVQAVWCPGMVAQDERFEPADLSVFTFGMAHKVRTRQYARLRDLLDATEKSYCLYVSTALHENTTFDDEFEAAFNDLKAIFGGRAYFLGYLSDAAVYNQLLSSSFFAAFFDQGVRANNTSVNAALQAGTVVVTNLDSHSPAALVHGEPLIDIDQAVTLPSDGATLAAIGENARRVALELLSWERLAQHLGHPPATLTPSGLALPRVGPLAQRVSVFPTQDA